LLMYAPRPSWYWVYAKGGEHLLRKLAEADTSKKRCMRHPVAQPLRIQPSMGNRPSGVVGELPELLSSSFPIRSQFVFLPLLIINELSEFAFSSFRVRFSTLTDSKGLNLVRS